MIANYVSDAQVLLLKQYSCTCLIGLSNISRHLFSLTLSICLSLPPSLSLIFFSVFLNISVSLHLSTPHPLSLFCLCVCFWHSHTHSHSLSISLPLSFFLSLLFSFVSLSPYLPRNESLLFLSWQVPTELVSVLKKHELKCNKQKNYLYQKMKINWETKLIASLK